MLQILALLLVLAVVLSGCVTVTVNFPAANVDEAAATDQMTQTKGPSRLHSVTAPPKIPNIRYDEALL